MLLNRQNLPVFAGCIIVGALFAITINNSFFLDTIYYGSKIPKYFYTNNFSDLQLPGSFYSGHIPAFSVYIALVWKILGRSLIVSHLAMLPFILGIIWQAGRLVRKFVPHEFSGLALLLILLDPTLLSQMTLVSPDVVLIFFFILGLNSVLENKRILISISIFFLYLTSMRGMFVSFGLLLTDILVNVPFPESLRVITRYLLRRSLIYLPAIVIYIIFSYCHYKTTGWIIFNENSPWAEITQRVGFKRILFNIGVVGWRILDLGRIGIWIVFSVLLLRLRKDILKPEKTRLLISVFFIFLVTLTVSMVWAKNLLAHRYFLPAYLCFSLLCANVLLNYQAGLKLKKALIAMWLIILISGNFWVYPDRIDKGWDATLAHLPYYKLRKDVLEYLDKQQIDYKNVQSFFPNTDVIDYIDMNMDNRSFAKFDGSGDYVITSNVFNVVDKDYDLIKTQYTVIRHFKRGQVYIDICKRKQQMSMVFRQPGNQHSLLFAR